LVRVERDGALERVSTDGPALRLLRRPSPRCSGLRFLRQVYADFSLTGNSPQERPAPGLLYRMHPKLAVPNVDQHTQRELDWRYGQRTVPLEHVLHVADISWSASANMILGTSSIQSLDRVLTAVLAAQDNMENQARRGRPEVVLSPASDDVMPDPESIRRAEANWERFTRDKKGAYISPFGLKAQFLNLTPREMEFSSSEERAIALTLMVLECPPARVFWQGGDAYGVDRQAMRTYWEALLKGMCALFADEWTHHLLGASANPHAARIEHDSTNIEALQVNYTERQLRAERWVNVFGMTTREAAAYEGFSGAPVGNATGRSTRPPDRQPEEPQDDRARSIDLTILRYLQGAGERYQRRLLAADGNLDALVARDEESLRCLVALERLGVPDGAAVEWSSDIATVADEAVYGIAAEAWARGVTRIGITGNAAFGAQRAATIADGIKAQMTDHRDRGTA